MSAPKKPVSGHMSFRISQLQDESPELLLTKYYEKCKLMKTRKYFLELYSRNEDNEN